MKNIIPIYSVHESGATDSWEWSVYLVKNNKDSYQLLIHQVLWDGEEDFEPGSYELSSLSTGSELFEFLQSAWKNAHEQGLDEEAWQEIVNSIQKLDALLANQVQQAAHLEFGNVDPVKSIEQLLIEQCIEGAAWDHQTFSGGGAMWGAFADRQRVQKAVSAYVRAYYAQHGNAPEGPHKILEKSVTFSNLSKP